MENYKSNSFKSKEDNNETSTNDVKVQKVVSGPVSTKKKNGIKKFTDNLINEDVPKIKDYIFADVLIPSFKKAISDIVRNGIDMILYGDSNRNKNNTPGSRVSYRSFYNSPSSNSVQRTSVVRSNYDYDDPKFSSRGDAELVLAQMEDIIDRYSFAKIADLYDLAGISTNNHCVNNYGWTDLRSAQIIRDGDWFIIKMPKALPID